MINIIQLYQDFHIPYETSGHKHVSRGWVGVPCPFCTGNPGFHLGYCIDSGNRYAGSFVCWRCGGKGAVKAISALTSSTEQDAKKIIGRYSTHQIISEPTQIRKKKRRHTKCQWPPGTANLSTKQKRYLQKRNFDPDELVKYWDLKGTGPAGSYKHRIIIPIYFQDKMVSYQGRDITGKSDMKYKACPQNLETRDHKHCLYGENMVEGESIVVCEGVTDVWRLGPGAVATFGIKFTMEQVKLISKYKLVYILFDTDPEAIEQASSLANYLSTMGIQCEIISLKEGDPADLSDIEARSLMLDLMG